MEVLEIVVGAMVAPRRGHHLARRLSLATHGDRGEIAEEQPRPVEHGEQ